MTKGWIGVDLDGTLAHYDKWRGVFTIGKPIQLMVSRVKRWIAKGKDVRIMTARVSWEERQSAQAEAVVKDWCLKHIGVELPITNCRDRDMVESWDDRAVQVVKNTGRRVDGKKR